MRRNSRRVRRWESLVCGTRVVVEAGQPVFFGSDCGQFRTNSSRFFNTELFEYEVCIHLFPVLSHVVIIDDAWRMPSTSHSRFRKRTACVRKSS